MAIIKCPECGNDISDKAATCPHCGVDVQDELHRINYKPNDEENLNKQSGNVNWVFANDQKSNKKISVPIVLSLIVLAMGISIIYSAVERSNKRYIEPSTPETTTEAQYTTIANDTVADTISTSEEGLNVSQEMKHSVIESSSVENDLIASSGPEETLYKVGESAMLGPLEFTLTDAHEATSEELNKLSHYPEGATYLIIRYKYKNISKDNVNTGFGTPVTVSFVDHNGTYYGSSDADWDIYSSFGLGGDEKTLFSSLHPGITSKGADAYEIAIDVIRAKGNKIKVRYDDSGETVYYSLDELLETTKQNSSNNYNSIVANNTSSGLYDPLLTKLGNVYAYFRDNETEQFTIKSDDDGYVRLLGTYNYNGVSGTEELVLERDPTRDGDGVYGYKIIENTRRLVEYDETTDTISIYDKYEYIEYTRYNSESNSVSGSFSGEATGIAGPVKVTITLDTGKIIDVQVEDAGETPGIGSKAIEELPAKMISGNTIQVDAISGATITSNAIKEAAKKALESAGLETG